MPSFNVILVLAVLSCVWVFVAAARLSSHRDRRNLLSTTAAVVVALSLASALLGSEWAIRRVAGAGFVEPRAMLESATATPSALGATNAYTAGAMESMFNSNRENALALVVATCLCLGGGILVGRKRQPPRAPEAATRAADLA